MDSKKEIEWINDAKSYNNRDLLEECFSQAEGDDWDGAFTADGMKRFQIFKNELELRLSDWLKGIKV